LDSNVYDLLVEAPESQRLVVNACERGQIELLMTHIQYDELINQPDEAKRAASLVIPFVIAPTYGMVPDTSKGGLARLGEPEKVDAIRSPTGKHTADALIATTAAHERAVLVTEDHRLTTQAQRQDLEVWTAAELISFVSGLDGDQVRG
jgi:predicted nucleic acid-binding protein